MSVWLHGQNGAKIRKDGTGGSFCYPWKLLHRMFVPWCGTIILLGVQLLL